MTTIPSQTRPRRAATVRHPALTNTNRERLQVGVGEEVDIYFDPPLGMSFPEEPLWWASAGGLEGELSPTLLGLSGSAVKFTDPSNAATANVRVIVRDITLDKTFTVREPSGVDHACYGNCSSPWTNVGFSWDIPGQWWTGGGQTNTMTNHWSQSFSIDASGTMAVQKFGHTATRNTNDVYTTIH